jgi:Rrf2 family protein
MALKLTQGADYAIRAMIHIAALPDGRWAMRREIAQAQKVPPDFVAKILQSLVRSGLLSSHRGSGGGFRLARPRDEINLLSIVEAIEGPLAMVACSSPEGGECDHAALCPADAVWRQVQRGIAAVLEQATLESLVGNRRRAEGSRSSAQAGRKARTTKTRKASE